MKRKRQTEAGFTLVEMAIVLMIFGLVSATVMSLVRYQTGKEYYEHTQTAMDMNDRATQAYQSIYLHYPCPADPTLAPGDPNYGYEARNPPVTGNCTLPTIAGTRDTNNDGAMDRVIVGVYPFNTILDPDQNGSQDDKVMDDYRAPYIGRYGLDGWGNKLTYAVTQSLADGNTNFDQTAGAIAIQSEDPDPVTGNLLEVYGSAHYVIVSHGENRVGAVPESGGLNPPVNCASGTFVPGVPAPPGTPRDETENCDLDEAVFLNGIKNDSRMNPYDDYIRYGAGTAESLWQVTGAFVDPNVGVPVYQAVAQNGGDVGIGLNQSTMGSPQEKLHVAGDIQAQQIQSDRICPSTGGSTLCMPVDVLAGNLPTMTCPTGQVAVAIEENQIRCENAFSSIPAGTCPSGQVMKGVSSKTGVICQ
jgi:prepilin-type N-terminal cleavage/methylation domain-containing protein